MFKNVWYSPAVVRNKCIENMRTPLEVRLTSGIEYGTEGESSVNKGTELGVNMSLLNTVKAKV